MRAQIRLQFYNVNGNKLICTRSMSLTQRKTTVSQKTLDTSLRQFDPRTGEVRMLQPCANACQVGLWISCNIDDQHQYAVQ